MFAHSSRMNTPVFALNFQNSSIKKMMHCLHTLSVLNNNDDNKLADQMFRFINILGFNFGKAKNA